MKLLVVVVILTLSASGFAGPVASEDQSVAVLQPREVDVFATYSNLIEKLVSDLYTAAKDATIALNNFNDGLATLSRQYAEKIVEDIKKLRDRVAGAIKGVTDRFVSTGGAVRNCIESHSSDAAAIFNETLENTMACTNQRIAEVSDMLTGLRTISDSATALAKSAMTDMNVCRSTTSNGVMSTGSCLGRVAVQTEMKAGAFITQTGLEIARVNMAVATLPAALDVCAGSRMVEAGLSTARVVMEVGSCSASGIFSIIRNPLF